MNNRLNQFFAIALLAAILQVGTAALAQPKPFKLRAETQGQAETSTSLNRSDILKRNSDPFSGESDDDVGGQALDAPASAFMPQRGMMAPQQNQMPYNLQALQNGTMPGIPRDLPSEGDMGPPQRQPRVDPSDPDSSPEMQLAWDAWHRRVAGTIFDRFSFFSKAAFKRSGPLIANLTYQVTKDGHIVNINMQQKSTNVLFNVLVYQAVKSLDGDMSVLAFPPGSRRTAVSKAGTFTQNYGQEGFRYTTNDVEQLKR